MSGSTKSYRIEEIPKEEVTLRDNETLIPVAHFHKVNSKTLIPVTHFHNINSKTHSCNIFSQHKQ
jgi:hypothetical protein